LSLSCKGKKAGKNVLKLVSGGKEKYYYSSLKNLPLVWKNRRVQ
jgi:hypothetical protein